MTIDYSRIEKAIEYLREHVRSQPSLADVAGHVHMSEYHFQRMFTRWAGISPKRFLEFLTVSFAKRLLASTDEPLLSTALKAGLSGTSRLHDLFVTLEGMSPGEHRKNGIDLMLRYGSHESPFGRCVICVSDRGVCGLAFFDGQSQGDALARFQKMWSEAELTEDVAGTAELVDKMFGRGKSQDRGNTALHCLVRGTNFQVKVWEALLKIPNGSITTYSKIAAFIGMPKAHRAVANAVGANPIAFLIPCHRVIRESGSLGGYRYGLPRKQAILAWENIGQLSDQQVV